MCNGDVTEIPVGGPAHDARPDPAGERIAYVTGGTLRVVHPSGEDSIAGGPPAPSGGASPPASPSASPSGSPR